MDHHLDLELSRCHHDDDSNAPAASSVSRPASSSFPRNAAKAATRSDTDDGFHSFPDKEQSSCEAHPQSPVDPPYYSGELWYSSGFRLSGHVHHRHRMTTTQASPPAPPVAPNHHHRPPHHSPKDGSLQKQRRRHSFWKRRFPYPPGRRWWQWQRLLVTMLVARFAWTLYYMHNSVVMQLEHSSSSSSSPPVSSSSDLHLDPGPPPLSLLSLNAPLSSNGWGRRVSSSSHQSSAAVPPLQRLSRKAETKGSTSLRASPEVEERHSERRRRTSPPPQLQQRLAEMYRLGQVHQALGIDNPVPVVGVSAEFLSNPILTNTHSNNTARSNGASSSSTQQLCHDAGLDASSRLLVLGLDGLTTSFILVAARKCSIRHVVVVDPLFPNLRAARLRRLHIHLRLLQRPAIGLDVQFHVPTNAATLLQLSWLKDFAATHVLAVQSSDLDRSADHVMDEPSRRLYNLHYNLLLWNQVLQWVRLLHHNQRAAAASRSPLPPRPRVLFASSAHAHEGHPHHDQLVARLVLLVSLAHASDAQSKSQDETAALLSLAHVNLPLYIVGPLMGSETANEAVRIQTASPNEPYADAAAETTRSVLYVSDAVNALLQAFGTLKPTPSQHPGTVRLFQVQSSPWHPPTSPTEWQALLHQVSQVTSTQNSSVVGIGGISSNGIGSSSQNAGWLHLAAIQTLQSQSELAPYYLPKSGGPTSISFPQGRSSAASMSHEDDSLHSSVFQSLHPHFPCSSACRRADPSHCQPSPWERVRPLSRRATAGCKYVVYLVFLHGKIVSLPKPHGGESDDDSKVCRVAFVHADSRLVQTELEAARKELQEKESDSHDAAAAERRNDEHWNGRIESNRWTLLWLNTTQDQLSVADHALPKIDPSRMFADSVERAMYAEYVEYVTPSDASLARILRNVDRPAFPQRYRRERRSGIPMIGRWVPVPAESARRTLLFASEPALTGGPSAMLPKNVREFVRIAGDEYYFPPQQLRYYDQVAHLVQTNDLRPEPEIRSTTYFSFPYQWLSMSILIHDLVSPPAQELRCRWYDEYLHWGGNRDAEELSLAFVLASLRISGGIGLPVSKSFDAPSEDLSWLPLMDSDGSRRVVDLKGDRQEVFVRIMKQRNVSPK